jgi:AcrR family transcriptional regulator
VGAARETVRREGNLSPETVADAAELSLATLYVYFSSKDALLAAAFDAALDEIGKAIEPILTVENLLDRGLEKTTHRLTRTVAKGFFRDGRLVALALARVGDSPEVRDVYNRRNNQQLDLLTKFVRLGILAGRIRSADAGVLARTTVVLLQALQNPLAQSQRSGPVIEEIARALKSLLSVDD